MTINDYQFEALRTCGDHIDIYFDNALLLDGVMGLVGEAGECADILKKHLFQGHPLSKLHMVKELGDVAWYLAVTAYALGYDLETVLQTNVDKLRERYPEGFDPERSQHRKEGDL